MILAKKNRIQGWCDRILFRNNSGNINVILYTTGDMYDSDHRPVKGLYNVEIKNIDIKKREKIEKTLYKITKDLEESTLIQYDKPYDIGDGFIYPNVNENVLKEEGELKLYQESLKMIFTKLSNTTTEIELTKSSINLLYSIIKKVITYLSKYKSNDKAIALAQSLNNLCQTIVNQSKILVNDISNAQEFKQLIDIFQIIIQQFEENI